MTHHLGLNRRRALGCSARHSIRGTSVLALLLATSLSVGLAAAVPSPQAERLGAAAGKPGRSRVVRFAGALAIAAASVLPPGVTAAPYEWVPGTQCTALRNVAGIENTTSVASTTTVFDWAKAHKDKVATPYPNALAANPGASAHGLLPGDKMTIPNAAVVLPEGGAELLRQASAHRKGKSGALPDTIFVTNELANYAAAIPLKSLRACLAGDSAPGPVEVVVVSAPAARQGAEGQAHPFARRADLVVRSKSAGAEPWYPGDEAKKVHYQRTGERLPAAVTGNRSPEGVRTVHMVDSKHPGVDFQWHGTQPGYGWIPGNWTYVNEDHIRGISIVNPDGSPASSEAIAKMNAGGGTTLGCKSSRNEDIALIAKTAKVGDPVFVRPNGAPFVFEVGASGKPEALRLHVAQPNPAFGTDHRPEGQRQVLTALAAQLKVDGKGDISTALREKVAEAFGSPAGTAIRIPIEQ